jgi:hypothetical protein
VSAFYLVVCRLLELIVPFGRGDQCFEESTEGGYSRRYALDVCVVTNPVPI